MTRTLFRVGLAFALFVPAGLALLYFTRERTLHPLLVRIAPPIARMAAGLELEIGDIDGDWRTGLHVAGFSLRKANGEPLGVLTSASADEVSIEGDLIGFARNLNRLELIESVRATSPVVRLDLTAPSTSSEESGPLRLPLIPRVTLTDGDLEIRLVADTLRFQGIEIDGAATEASPLTVRTAASAAEWSAVVDGAVVRQSERRVGVKASIPEGMARGIDVTLEALVGAWSPEETTIEQGSLTVGPNHLTPAGVTLTSGPQGVEAGGNIAFDLKDVQDAYRVVNALRGVEDTGDSQNAAGWSGQLRGTIALEPMPGQISTGDVTISGEELEIAGVRLGSVSGFATADRRGVYLHELRAVDGERSELRGSGTLLADGRTLDDGELTVLIDRPQSLHSSLEPIRGLRAEFSLAGELANPSGSVELFADSLNVGGQMMRDVAADGALMDGVLDLNSVECKTEYGNASASARIGLPLDGRPLDLLLQTLRWESDGATLALAEPVPILVEGEHVKIDGLVLTTGKGRAALTFDSETAEGLALDLEIKGLELEPFVGEFAAAEGMRFGALHGTAAIRTKSARTQGVEAAIDLALDRSRDPAAAPMRAKLKATWADERIEFQDVLVELDALQLQIAGGAPLATTGELLGPGKVDLQVRLGMDAATLSTPPISLFLGQESLPFVERLSGRAFANVHLDGAWDSLRGSLQLDVEEARLAPAVGRVPLLPDALTGSLALRFDEAITLEPSNVRLGKVAHAVVSGSLARSLDATALVADPAARLEEWRSSAITAEAKLDFDSLDWIARFLPELRETSGSLSGLAQVRGSLRDLEPNATLVLKDGGARYRGLPPLENAQVEIKLDPIQIQIVRADMELGASPVSIGGTVLYEQGQPRIDATIKGTEVLLARSTDALIRADVDLTLRGRTSALVVGGDVALAGGRLRSPIEFQGLLAGGSKAPQAVRRGIRIPAFGPDTVKLDLKIRTTEALSLKGRIARGKIRAELQLIGTAAQPTPIGQVFFDPLELAVPAGTISFPTGLIRFDPDSPDIPRIDLVGTTRLAGYDVTVNVDGDYDAPNVELSSSPPLAPEDLLLLVLSGQPPSRGGGIEAAGQSVALYVAKDLVRGWFSSGGFEDEDKESFLDRLEVTTGRDVSRSGTLTLEATYKLREGLARERDAIYVVLERDSYEDYGLGLRFVLRLR
ncbi:translocation/assembly module TamB domain-containing protein [Saltatorellus ferox]|uniref:translocation/assembly module TamB domain-containing protein n=1 Tax=Saltatorellus ferox TaxID=2528018 RepID=UPI003AF3D873